MTQAEIDALAEVIRLGDVVRLPEAAEKLLKEVSELRRRSGKAKEALDSAPRLWPPGPSNAAFQRLRVHVTALLDGEPRPPMTLVTGEELP